MVETSSQNRALSASSDPHPLRADDKSCQPARKGVLPPAVLRRSADAVSVRTMRIPNVIIPSRAVLPLLHELHLRVFQRLRAIPAGGPT